MLKKDAPLPAYLPGLIVNYLLGEGWSMTTTPYAFCFTRRDDRITVLPVKDGTVIFELHDVFSHPEAPRYVEAHRFSGLAFISVTGWKLLLHLVDFQRLRDAREMAPKAPATFHHLLNAANAGLS